MSNTMTIELHKQQQRRLEDRQRELGLEIARMLEGLVNIEEGAGKDRVRARIEHLQENHQWIMQQLNESYGRFGNF